MKKARIIKAAVIIFFWALLMIPNGCVTGRLIVIDSKCQTKPLDKNSAVFRAAQKELLDRDPEYITNSLTSRNFDPLEAVAADINGDGKNEKFIFYDYGSGGRWYLVYQENPVKLIGDLWADLLFFKQGKNQWPRITILTRNGCDTAYVNKLKIVNDQYEIYAGKTLHEYDGCTHGQISNFRNKIGSANCGNIEGDSTKEQFSNSFVNPLTCGLQEVEMWPIKKEWLVEQVIMENIEHDNLVDGIPFGFMNKEWTEFKTMIQPGDQIWFFNTPINSWGALMGQKGYVLIRNCKIVAKMTTEMN